MSYTEVYQLWSLFILFRSVPLFRLRDSNLQGGSHTQVWLEIPQVKHLELTVQLLGAAVWWQTVWDPYAHWQCSTSVLLQLAYGISFCIQAFVLSVLGEAFPPLSLPHHSQGSHIPGIRVSIWFPFSLCVSRGRPSPESQHLRSALSVTAFDRWCTKHTDEYCSKNSFILTSHLQSGFFSWHHLGAISSSPPCSSHVCPPHL